MIDFALAVAIALVFVLFASYRFASDSWAHEVTLTLRDLSERIADLQNQLDTQVKINDELIKALKHKKQ